MQFLVQFIFTIIGLFLGIVFGIPGERRHFRNLAQREEAMVGFPVINLKRVPAGIPVGSGRLVTGQVVMGSDYLKTLFSKFRNIFGGEMKSFERVMERARRESLLRMAEQAVGLGATAIINVRFETSRIGSTDHKGGVPMAEVLCYGTAIFPTDGPAEVHNATELVSGSHG